LIIRQKTKEVSRLYVERKLVFKLRRLAVVLIIISAIIGYDVLKSYINPLLAVAGIALGFYLGSFVGRYSNIHWHEETSKVISRLDRISIVILVLYLAFSFSKKWIFGHWIHGLTLTAFSFSIAAGVMAGRILTMRKQIREILRDKGFLPKKHQN